MSDQSLLRVGSIEALREATGRWRAAGETIVLVPTMGALHAGHLSLVEEAKRVGQRVVVSIFVNPTQFGPNEDFSRYPRVLEADLALLREAQADLAWLPGVEIMYPEGFATRIEVGGPSGGLCGDLRPGHFSGVATVVTKLLHQVQPDIALFGEKDFQQLKVIQRMVHDLDMPFDIRGVPTLREPDGLALSSRNRYLSPEERAKAPELHRVMADLAGRLGAAAAAGPLLCEGLSALETAGFRPQYLELRDAETLASVTTASRPARLLAAAYLGNTRLIDNLPVTPV
ncbi:pantoate--beta-alanine ligase [Methylobacterium organophilum]|uniref:Pantothenate synthetase n=1 Tax=Methylobacterium organophilum TaxID=410 RepID=A0ABQ4T3B7_METOR|nr:pantoate--beta-alanine ligase [Methylobacterium organophilum]GJE26146.1 Pantothenate synthetase [Methylobacterium organophilum]